MSWQVYVDSNLVGTGKIAHAAILGQAGGGSVWAKSANIGITDKEVKDIVAGFNSPESFQANGIRVGGTKYMCLQADEGRALGKKGADGAVVVKSTQAIIVGIYKEGTQPGDANKIVEELGDYLKSVGFSVTRAQRTSVDLLRSTALDHFSHQLKHLINMARRFFVAANWKMNGDSKSLFKLVDSLNDAKLDSNVEVVIAPPTIYLIPIRDRTNKPVVLSGQNCYIDKEGAFTGEVSPWQLSEEQIPWVILGHSERRHVFREINEDIASKTEAALKFGLKVMLCVGEQLSEREAGKTLEVIEEQLRVVVEKKLDWSKIVIAYEPVWAIGTGKVATPEQAQEVHADIRKYLGKAVSSDVAQSVRVVYGGSVNGKNCKDLSSQPDIDGFLVGGASLKPEFVDIINCKPKAKA